MTKLPMHEIDPNDKFNSISLWFSDENYASNQISHFWAESGGTHRFIMKTCHANISDFSWRNSIRIANFHLLRSEVSWVSFNSSLWKLNKLSWCKLSLRARIIHADFASIDFIYYKSRIDWSKRRAKAMGRGTDRRVMLSKIALHVRLHVRLPGHCLIPKFVN